MELQRLNNLTIVTLSRKNLEGLTHQLDHKGSKDAAQIIRRTKEGLLIVVAEENKDHYEDRSSGASSPADMYGEIHG